MTWASRIPGLAAGHLIATCRPVVTLARDCGVWNFGALDTCRRGMRDAPHFEIPALLLLERSCFGLGCWLLGSRWPNSSRWDEVSELKLAVSRLVVRWLENLLVW